MNHFAFSETNLQNILQEPRQILIQYIIRFKVLNLCLEFKRFNWELERIVWKRQSKPIKCFVIGENWEKGKKERTLPSNFTMHSWSKKKTSLYIGFINLNSCVFFYSTIKFKYICFWMVSYFVLFECKISLTQFGYFFEKKKLRENMSYWVQGELGFINQAPKT